MPESQRPDHLDERSQTVVSAEWDAHHRTSECSQFAAEFAGDYETWSEVDDAGHLLTRSPQAS